MTAMLAVFRIVLDFDLSLPSLPCFTIVTQRFIIKP